MEPSFYDLMIWIAWFSVIAFMKVFSLLTRDRFEYNTTFQPELGKYVHYKYISLLSIISVVDLFWCYFCVAIFESVGYTVVLLLVFECFTLFLDTLQTIVKYVIHLVDISYEGVWEQRGTYVYYTEFCTDVLVLLATLGHYVHILIVHGVSFTLIDAILLLNMRVVFNNLRSKLTSYKNYIKLIKNMEQFYTTITIDSSNNNNYDDICAICHDKMTVAKQLPCNHIFHYSCLRSWLEHHSSCPTCRFSLINNINPVTNNNFNNNNINLLNRNNGNNDINNRGGVTTNRNQLLHFNGSRWFSWLPTIEVVSEHGVFFNNNNNNNHINNNNNRNGRREEVILTEEIITNYVNQLSELFPHIPNTTLRNAILRYQSIDSTIENILDGNVIVPPAPITTTTTTTTTTNNNTIVTNSNTATDNNHSNNANTETNRTTITTTANNNSSNYMPKLADNFATTAQERQLKLQQRKAQMLELARK